MTPKPRGLLGSFCGGRDPAAPPVRLSLKTEGSWARIKYDAWPKRSPRSSFPNQAVGNKNETSDKPYYVQL